jgi:2-methylisocitrate lyase-like PEP mutase family enzyme
MAPRPSPAAALRHRLADARPLLLPGCADALTARIAVDVGFEAIYATGAGISNALLGMPDVGLATMTEMVEQVGRICDAAEVPVIADMDTGYGNAVNARRAIRALEAAGVAGVQIEDQVFPKRCGHFAGKDVVPAAEMRAKLLAVLDARRDADTVVIARTDAIAVEGAEQAIERANLYAELGADLVFVEAPPTRELLAELPRRIDAPLVANMVEGGLTPIHSLDELAAMGYRVVLYANTALRVGMLAVQSALGILRSEGSSRSLSERLISWEERQELVGKPDIDRLEARYADRDLG